MRETLRVIQRCTSTHRDGAPSMAQSRASGYRTGHDPGAQEARCKGGHANSRSAWAGKLLPARLQPIIFLSEDSSGELQCGKPAPGRVGHSQFGQFLGADHSGRRVGGKIEGI
jgi:hypothetical protein